MRVDVSADLVRCREIVSGPMRTGFARKTGTVRDQLLNRDLRIAGFGGLDLEPWQVLRDGIVQAELSCIAELHDCGRREQFAVRGHPEFGGWSNARVCFLIRVSEALGPDQLLI